MLFVIEVLLMMHRVIMKTMIPLGVHTIAAHGNAPPRVPREPQVDELRHERQDLSHAPLGMARLNARRRC
jgi:hypothetical protein